MNWRIASGFIPLSLRDCSDHVCGSFHPVNSPDRIFLVLSDFDIFAPLISHCPLYIEVGFGQLNIPLMKSWTRVDMWWSVPRRM